jgi:2'-5' RNA ligase
MNQAQKPLRLFVAASIPEEELRRVDEGTKDLRDRLIGARWAPLENQHVTLKFLGSTPLDVFDDVNDTIEKIVLAHPTTDISVAGLGVFPSPRRARVLWAGIRDDANILTSIAESLARALGPLGFEPEKRSFTPHLTLARFRVPAPVERDRLQLEEGPAFRLESIDLYRSHLSPKGARYEVLRRFALGEDKNAGA